MAGGVIFAELHVVAGERQETSDLVGIATSPVLSLFKRRRGQLFTVTDPNRAGAEGICRKLIEIVEDEYFRVPSRSITRSLQSAISAANEVLRAENAKLPADKHLRVGLCCAAVRDGDVFVAQVSPATAFILHNGLVTRVFGGYGLSADSGGRIVGRASDSLGSRLDPHINFGFSPIGHGDLVVLASGASWKMIPDRYILDAAKQIDPEMAAQALYGSFTAHVRRPTTSMVVVKMSDLPARALGVDKKRVRTAGDSGNKAKPKKEQLPDGVLAASEFGTGPSLGGRGGAAALPRPHGGIEWEDRRPPRVSSAAERAEVRRPRSSTGLSVWDKVKLSLGRGLRPVPRLPGLSTGGNANASVKLRRPPQMRGERSGRGWLSQVVMMIVLAAVFVAIGNAGIGLWKSWQVGDPHLLVKEAQEKQTLAATAERPVARAALVQAGELVDRALQVQDDQTTRALAASIRASLDRIDGVVRIDSRATVVDFSPVIQDKGDVTQVVVDGENLYVLDEGQDRLFRYALSADGRAVQEPGKHPVVMKKGDRVDGRAVAELLNIAWVPAGQLRTQSGLFLLENERSFIVYDPKVGASRIDVADNKRWGAIQAVSGFAGGLYLLDTKEKDLYYYPPTKNGYESQPYLILDSNGRVDLSKATDIALDGNLYVLESGGTVRRFTREGRPLDFVGDVPEGKIAGPRALFASAATRSLYVLDTAGERVLQFSPEGKFQRQFRADGRNASFKEARDLFVDEAARRIYLLTRGALIEFDLPPMQ